MNTTHLQEYNLWHYVWKLFRLRFVITISGLRRAKLRRKIGFAILALVVLSVIIIIFIGSWSLLRLLSSPQLTIYVGDVTAFFESLPSAILTFAFIGILLTSFGVLLQALYLAGDMDFLLSSPIPIRAVFITKMLQAVLPNFGLIALFGFPVLYGLGAAEHFNFLFYPLVILIMASLALAAAGISSLLVMGVVRVLPARRVAEVLAFFGAIISVICSQAGYITNSFDFSKFTGDQYAQPIQLVGRLNTPLSPIAWAGHGLMDIGSGQWFSGLGLILLTFVLTWGLFLLSLIAAERLYYTGWASIQVGQRRKKPARQYLVTQARRVPLQGLVGIFLPSPVRAIIAKDFTILRRDLRNMSQVVTPLIFGIIYAFMLISSRGEPPAGRGMAPDWWMKTLENAMVYGNVAISFFVGWSLLSRLAMMSFSQEGKHYWMLKSSPVSARQLILAKYLVAYLPSLILGWLFLLAISILQGSGVNTLLFGLIIVALCNAGTAGINLAFGVRGANLAWEDPRHMGAGSSGCFAGVVTLGYLPMILLLFFGPAIVFPMLGLPEVIGQMIGLVVGGIISLVCAIFPPVMVVGRVSRIGEA